MGDYSPEDIVTWAYSAPFDEVEELAKALYKAYKARQHDEHYEDYRAVKKQRNDYKKALNEKIKEQKRAKQARKFASMGVKVSYRKAQA